MRRQRFDEPVAAEQRAAASVRHLGGSSETLEHVVDGVLGHLAVRRQLAAGDA